MFGSIIQSSTKRVLIFSQTIVSVVMGILIRRDCNALVNEYRICIGEQYTGDGYWKYFIFSSNLTDTIS